MSPSKKIPAILLPQGKWVMAWGGVLGLAILAFVWNLFVILRDTNRDAAYLSIVANLRVLAQQLDASARESAAGAASFASLSEARSGFGGPLRSLANSTDELPSPREMLAEELDVLGRSWAELDAAAATIVDKQQSILFLVETSSRLAEAIPQVQERSARVVQLLAASGAPARAVALAKRQAFLSERIARNVERMLRGSSDTSAASAQFSEDTAAFVTAMDDLGRLPQLQNNADAQAALREMQTLFGSVSESRQRILDSAPDLTQARTAADTIVQGTPRVIAAMSVVSDRINDFGSQRTLNTTTALVLGMLIVVALVVVGVQSSLNARRRLELTAQTNERNQQAILRLLDELAGLADGDLTTTATVTEDFTGAIADAINFTIDQLRGIVSSINGTSRSVSDAADDTQATALHLAEAAEHQAQEITGASAAVNEMAITIDQVSSNAAESAAVADRSVALAKTGSQVVQNTIGGMDTIREQIQDTAKRIKRLGESSQEIGDIVSLINDISDQTNILALNAAIQASMAGDAGRGFAVVADEVQRLAERSGAATKQIEALVKTIQSDTHEAVMSMEQTTAEVVRGARLAEDAGVALEEIESVSKNLAALIQNISNAARQQASSAGHISNTMNIIQEITSQTSAGTTATAQAIGKLATSKNELRNSVAGFKLPDEGRSSASRTR
ncbi:MAG: methyl-accepting chemotaxis protein [Gammaproteobacteria bacterium]